MRRRRAVAPPANHERWLVSYADFITLLFAFFTTLYAISTVDKQKAGKLQQSMASALNLPTVAVAPPASGAGRAADALFALFDHLAGPPPPVAPSPTRLELLARALSQMANAPALRGRVRVGADARGVVVSLAEAGFFEVNHAEVRRDALPALEEVANRLVDYDSRQPLQIVVEGHTDDRPVRGGRYHSNLELSTARATFVVGRLVDQHRLPPARVAAAGYGEWRPAAPNDRPEGRARNRRVDIRVQIDDPHPSPQPLEK